MSPSAPLYPSRSSSSKSIPSGDGDASISRPPDPSIAKPRPMLQFRHFTQWKPICFAYIQTKGHLAADNLCDNIQARERNAVRKVLYYLCLPVARLSSLL